MEETFPLVVCVAPSQWHELHVAKMTEEFERYFARGDRYALLTYAPRGASFADARIRRTIAEWANDGRVRKVSAELCVGSSTVVHDPFARAALRALTWFWKPACPQHTCAAADAGFEWCLTRLNEARVPLGRSAHELRARILASLEPR